MKKSRFTDSQIIAVLASALAGCGQKGPLYLPDDDKTVKERDKDVFL